MSQWDPFLDDFMWYLSLQSIRYLPLSPSRAVSLIQRLPLRVSSVFSILSQCGFLLSSPLLPVNTARLPGYWFCPICIKGDWRGAKGERERGGRMETKKGGQQQSPQGFRAHWRQTAGGGGGERGNRGGWGHAVSLSLSVCLLESRLNCQFPPSFSTNATATLSNTTQAL